ncbi:putative Heat shock protein DnaJ, cysteine-rich domain superfamily [Helianthus anomalus]
MIPSTSSSPCPSLVVVVVVVAAGDEGSTAEKMFTLSKFSLEDLYNGTSKKLSLSRNVICSKCKGKGLKSSASMKCGGCQGSGMKVSI